VINKRNIVGAIAVAVMVLLSAVPSFAASPSSTQPVEVTVSPTVAIAARWAGGGNNSTITLGTIPADNIQRTFTGGPAGQEIMTFSNVGIDIWTRLADNFAGIDPFAPSNFRFTGLNITVPRSYTTTYQIIGNNTPKAPAGNHTIFPVTFDITIPFGTAPGGYTNTVFFSAVQHGFAAPTTP